MSAKAITHVEVYLFRRRAGRIELLVLRRARGRSFPGVWQPVTGRIRRGEQPSRAAAREVREETGLVPRRWWALESPALYLDLGTERMSVLPLFVAEVAPSAVVRLSREHDAFEFTSRSRAARRFLWEAQRQACAQLFRQVLRRGPLERALDVTDRIPRSRPARRGRRATT